MKNMFLSILLLVVSLAQAQQNKISDGDFLKLLKDLQSDHYGDRLEAAQKFGELGEQAAPAISALLVAYAKETDEYGRHFEKTAIIRMGSTAVPVLISALRDNNAKVRESACRFLAEIKGAAILALPALQDALRSEQVAKTKEALERAIATLAKTLPQKSEEDVVRERLLAIFALVQDGKNGQFAKFLAYNGRDVERKWKDVSDYGNEEEKAGVDRMARYIKEFLGRADSYFCSEFSTPRQAGAWCIWEVTFSEKGRSTGRKFSFVKIGDQYCLSEIE